jgi:hypothetical protein
MSRIILLIARGAIKKRFLQDFNTLSLQPPTPMAMVIRAMVSLCDTAQMNAMKQIIRSSAPAKDVVKTTSVWNMPVNTTVKRCGRIRDFAHQSALKTFTMEKSEKD